MTFICSMFSRRVLSCSVVFSYIPLCLVYVCPLPFMVVLLDVRSSLVYKGTRVVLTILALCSLCTQA